LKDKNMFDVVVFGSATEDIFLELPHQKNDADFLDKKECFCLPFGSKILIDDMEVFSGGGGTNVACSLANLGFNCGYYGKVGKDSPGQLILNDLKKFKVKTNFCLKDKNLQTAVSFIASSSKDRAILIYKGACHFLLKEEINFEKIKKTKWFYLAPFYEKTADLLPVLVKFAKENGIKIAVNPSIYQIQKEEQSFFYGISKADILFLNKEEAENLTKKFGASIKDIGKFLLSTCKGIVVITAGSKGAFVFEGENMYKAEVYKKAVCKDKTGAGDSFGAGFLAGLLAENNIEYAIRVAMVNSAKNISQKGAKNGLLAKSELKFLPNIDIIKERLF